MRTLLTILSCTVWAFASAAVLAQDRGAAVLRADPIDGKRVALVIGNSAYEHAAPLKNPKNDALALSAILERLGFEVILGTDLTRSAFERKVRDFAVAARRAEAALLYFGGHGLQVNGRNYLMPVDAQLADEADLAFQTVRLNDILSQMERDRRINLVFLDACRDNPLGRNLARTMGTRSASVGTGLARVESGIGTLIAFATQPGNVALDGQGNHSPFADALMRHIETPNLDVEALMRRVRKEVMANTGDRQVPWSNSSLVGSFSFLEDQSAADASESRLTQAPLSPAAQAWAVTKDAQSVAVLKAFVEKFPGSVFATLAKARIAELQKAANGRIAAVRPPPKTDASEIDALNRKSDEAIVAKLPKWGFGGEKQGWVGASTYNLNNARLIVNCNSGNLADYLYSFLFILPTQKTGKMPEGSIDIWLEIDGVMESIQTVLSGLSVHDDVAHVYHEFNTGNSFEQARHELFQRLSAGRILKVHIRELGVSEVFTLKGSRAALAYCEKRVAEWQPDWEREKGRN